MQVDGVGHAEWEKGRLAFVLPLQNCLPQTLDRREVTFRFLDFFLWSLTL